MATPKINENCHYMQNNSHKCKIKLEKIHFDILCRFGVIKGNLPEGEVYPPGEIRLNCWSFSFSRTLTSYGHSNLFTSHHIEQSDFRLKPRLDKKRTSEMIERVIFPNMRTHVKKYN